MKIKYMNIIEKGVSNLKSIRKLQTKETRKLNQYITNKIIKN
jgi:hypothetical protein